MKIKDILKRLGNKYLIATLLFAAIVVFFDQYNFSYHKKNYRELENVRNTARNYEEKIREQNETIKKLESDSAYIEKIAREKYMMKRSNETIYVLDNDDEN